MAYRHRRTIGGSTANAAAISSTARSSSLQRELRRANQWPAPPWPPLRQQRRRGSGAFNGSAETLLLCHPLLLFLPAAAFVLSPLPLPSLLPKLTMLLAAACMNRLTDAICVTVTAAARGWLPGSGSVRHRAGRVVLTVME